MSNIHLDDNLEDTITIINAEDNFTIINLEKKTLHLDIENTSTYKDLGKHMSNQTNKIHTNNLINKQPLGINNISNYNNKCLDIENKNNTMYHGFKNLITLCFDI